MNPSYEDFVDQTFSKRYRQLELEIMKDIVRRIKKTSEITSSADWQIMRLTIMGNSAEEIRNMIKEAGELSENDMQKLFDDVVEKEYTRSADLYKEVGANFMLYEQNTEMQQLTQALITQSNNELKSITGTMGFMLDYGDGQGLRFTPHTEIFSDYLNNAVMGVASGAFDYNTMIRKVVTQMTNSGLRTVDYASGRHDRVDVAARRAVLTGLSQLTGRITDTNAAALNTDHFEVAWHAGARPTHQVWQGRVWSKKELVEVCGLGSVTGLLGANCYHDYYPFIPGVSERMYSDEWLDEMNREENTPKTFMGKEYTAYEARQHQRYIERCMRAQREKVELLKEGGADKDDIMLARCKYQAQLDEYKRFSKAMKLPEQRERIYYDMKGRIAPTRRQMQEFYENQYEKFSKGEKVPDPTKNLDAAYKAQSNRKADERQLAKYREVLGKEAPSTIEEFQNIKYNDDKEAYGNLKHMYRIANQYESRSGWMPASKITELHDEATRQKALFNREGRGSANMAIMDFDGATYFANSKATNSNDPAFENFKGDKSRLILLVEDTRFIEDNFDHYRGADSERKLFEYASTRCDDGEKHVVYLLSEKEMCPSCEGIMKQFKARHQEVTVNAVCLRKDKATLNNNRNHVFEYDAKKKYQDASSK